MSSNLLKFGKGNAKLDGYKEVIYTFSLPSGFTCPFALDCLSKANRETGKIKDGPHTQFRCFSASQESVYPSVRKSRWHNFNLLLPIRQDRYAMAGLIRESLPRKAKIVRIHVGGDFFNEEYFQAWKCVAQCENHIIFYAYTKSLSYWIREKEKFGLASPCWEASPGLTNFRLTASYGGSQDELIEKHNLRAAKVVFSVKEAKIAGLPIDHNDSHAIGTGGSFALLLHGTQPKGSDASRALVKLKGKGSYSRKKE